jgi:hypothetical protein
LEDLGFLELLKAEEFLVGNQCRSRLASTDQDIGDVLLGYLVEHRLEPALKIGHTDDFLH